MRPSSLHAHSSPNVLSMASSLKDGSSYSYLTDFPALVCCHVRFFCSSPNVLSMASSLKDESSYSYLTDLDVGLSLIDRFTWSTLDFFEKVDINSALTLADLVQIYK